MFFKSPPKDSILLNVHSVAAWAWFKWSGYFAIGETLNLHSQIQFHYSLTFHLYLYLVLLILIEDLLRENKLWQDNFFPPSDYISKRSFLSGYVKFSLWSTSVILFTSYKICPKETKGIISARSISFFIVYILNNLI